MKAKLDHRRHQPSPESPPRSSPSLESPAFHYPTNTILEDLGARSTDFLSPVDPPSSRLGLTDIYMPLNILSAAQTWSINPSDCWKLEYIARYAGELGGGGRPTTFRVRSPRFEFVPSGSLVYSYMACSCFEGVLISNLYGFLRRKCRSHWLTVLLENASF